MKFILNIKLLLFFAILLPNYNLAQSCGTAQIFGEDLSGNPIAINNFNCDDDPIVLWGEFDNVAGGFVTPALIFEITTDLFGGAENEFYLLEDGNVIFFEDLASNTVFTLTGQFLDPNSNYSIVLCEAWGDGGVSYVIRDPVCGTVLSSGNFPVGTTGCLEFGVWSPIGTSSFSGPGIVNSFAFGAGIWDPLVAGPGTHDITYCFNQGVCCNTCITQQITVTNPYSATISSVGPLCSDGATVDLNNSLQPGSTTGGTWSGNGVNAAGIFDPVAAGVGNHVINYDVGFGGSCVASSSISILVEDCCIQPPTPATACYETATFNTTTCAWDVTGTQDPEPATACYETTTFNTGTCAWEVTGTQPPTPTTACYETATFNTTSCAWEITGTQPPEPATACYETATFNTTTCAWEVSGTQDPEPATRLL